MSNESFTEFLDKLSEPPADGKKKIVYLCHPIRGDVKGNVDKLLRIIRQINMFEPWVIPCAPYIADCLCMNDEIPTERQRGLDNGLELIKRIQVDECRLYGDRISPGMQAEKELFESLGVKVVDLTDMTTPAIEKRIAILDRLRADSTRWMSQEEQDEWLNLTTLLATVSGCKR